MTGYCPHAIARLVGDALAERPVVVVTGLRQAGKSTFLQNEKALASRRYVSLDDYAQLAVARSDGLIHGDDPLTIEKRKEVRRRPTGPGHTRKNTGILLTNGRTTLRVGSEKEPREPTTPQGFI